jgi:hypothetical protein
MGSRSWCAGRLRACSGSSGCSGSAQAEAAFARVRRLKRNQQQGELILSLEGLCEVCRGI